MWRLLLDPKVMAGCVPGMQSVEVLSDTEYIAEIKVKISFISAKFKIKTTILETAAAALSALRGHRRGCFRCQFAEADERDVPDRAGRGGTEMRIKMQAEVLGRLGSFGLSVMKTKADRMWGGLRCELCCESADRIRRPALGLQQRQRRQARHSPQPLQNWPAKRGPLSAHLMQSVQGVAGGRD